ncbi:MAG: hypothetical protein DRP67_02315 [Candidatus Omnitrophota bacterium]|nr:MAG: hypothetical protein DRP67_02315 [Candidatus Omnitrophota bacterium]
MEKYSERESVKVGKASVKLAGAEFFNIIFGAFYFLFLTRILTPFEMSVIAVMSVVTNLSSILFGFGFQPAIKKLIPSFVVENRIKEIKELLNLNYLTVFLFYGLSTAVFFHFSPLFSKIFLKNPDHFSLMRIISFAILTNKLFEISYSTLVAFQKFNIVSTVSILNGGIIRIYALSLYLFNKNINSYLIGIITGQAFLVLLMIFQLKKYLFKKCFYSFTKLFKFSWPFYLNAYIGYGKNHADTFLVSIFLKPELLATYYVVKRFVEYIERFMVSIVTPLTPKMIELKNQGKEVIEKIFTTSTRYLSYIIFPISFFTISISHFLLHIYGKGRYLHGLPVLIILALSTIFTVGILLFQKTIFVMARPIELTKLSLVNSSLSIILPLALIGRLNILGIGIGKLLSSLITFFFGYYLTSKFIKVNFDFKGIWRIFSLVLFLCILSLTAQRFIHTYGELLSIFPWVFLFLPLFIIMISEKDKKTLMEILKFYRWKRI